MNKVLELNHLTRTESVYLEPDSPTKRNKELNLFQKLRTDSDE